MSLAYKNIKISFMKYLVVFFVLIPLLGFTQNTDVSESKFSIGLSFSPDYSFRKIVSDNSLSSNSIVNHRDTFEIPKLGFTGGLSLQYRLGRVFTIETGLYFSDKGEKTNDMPLIMEVDEGMRNVRFVYHTSYIDIPLKTNINLLSGNFKAYISAGVVANVFIFERNVSFVEYASGKENKNSSLTTTLFDYNRLALGFMAGFGLSYDISDKFTCKFEPNYKRFITSATHAPIKGFFYSTGLNVGVDYKF